MRRVAAGIPLLLALWAGVAVAQTNAQLEDARMHHKKAVVHFNLDEWKDAAAEFKEAYRLHSDPLFLFNIGQCYRKLGDQGEALSYYKKYLRTAPHAANRAEVERRVEELEAAMAAASKSREAPPPNVLAPPDAQDLPRAAPSLPDFVPPPPAAVVATQPLPPEPAPVYKRWWFWAGVGGAVAAGVTAAVLLSASGGRSPYIGDLPPGRIRVPAP
jgi:tetratricopeptide (TPR) repeat protein